MKTRIASLALSLCLASSGLQAVAQSSGQKCPVLVDHVDMSYKHEGGESKPQVRVRFGNEARKQIATVTFTLSVLDADGYPKLYPDDLTYRDGLEAGEKKIFAWDLAPDSVDIHRTGETVLLQKVEFADGSSWVDDGSQSCVLTVDFHPK